MRHICLLILALLAVSSPALAQERPAGPSSAEEAASFFLLDATHARAILRDRGNQMLADRLWTAAGRYTAAISEAEPETQRIFIPALQGMRTVLREAVIEPREIDLPAVDALLTTLDDQVRIQTSPGSDPARNGVRVRVTARRNGQLVTNYYVWLDLTGTVPKDRSEYGVSLASSPAIADVPPGDFLVRVRNASLGPVVQFTKVIGNLGAEESLDIIIP